MERLSNKDFRALLEFIRESYAITDLDSFSHRVISRLPKLVPSEITSYNEVDFRKLKNSWLWHPGPVPTDELKRIFERHILDHPLITCYRQKRVHSALKITDFLNRNKFHRSGLYNEFFRHFDVEHQIAFTFPTPLPNVIGIALNRSSPDFSERERLTLNLLRPHLIQAYRNAEAFTKLQGHIALVSDLLEEVDEGVVLLSIQGKVMLANSRARDYMQGYFGECSLKNNRVPEELQRWIKHQDDLREQTDNVPPPCKPYIVEREGRRLTVRLAWDTDQRLLLLEEQVTGIQRAVLEPLGLSNRQAEILTWVAYGKTNAEIGMILGLSPRTVQKHLEHIFQKLGVETRTAAAAKAHEIASTARR